MLTAIITVSWLVFVVSAVLTASRMASHSADVRQGESQPAVLEEVVGPFVQEYIAEQGSV